MAKADPLKIWLIGSDISQDAIQTAEANLKVSEFDKYHKAGLFELAQETQALPSLSYQSHWPLIEDKSALMKFDNKPYLSLYQGSFHQVGMNLA